MTWRKVLVRGLVFTVASGLTLGAILYRAWTSPQAVRQQVLGKLGQICTGAIVSLESAHMRLFGGIAVSELRMARRDDLHKGDFLYVPSLVIYHDKEKMLDGTLAVRKLEMTRPRLRLIRERDGTWSLQGILSPPDLSQRLPTMVVQEGSVVFEDRSFPGTPLLEVHDIALTAINDPLPTLVIEGTGRTDILGPIQISARLQRATGQTAMTLELPAIPVGPGLVQRLSVLSGDLATHLRHLRGDGKLQASLNLDPGASPPLTVDATCQLKNGELSHARLPLPLTQLATSFRFLFGPGGTASFLPDAEGPSLLRVPTAHLEARAGEAGLEVSLRDLVLPALGKSFRMPELTDIVRELTWKVERFRLTPQVWEYLPEKLAKVRDSFKPEGLLSVSHTFTREDAQTWHKKYLISLLDMSTEFVHFPYPVGKVRGTVEREEGNDQPDHLTLSLVGEPLGGGTVSLRGTLEGEHGEGMSLELTANGMSISERLIAALPEAGEKVAREFHPTGKVHVRASLQRSPGDPRPRNHYLVTLEQGTLRYDLFPYPLENASGVLELEPGHWECRDLRGTHKGGELRVQARSIPPQQSHPSVVQAGRQQVSAPDAAGQGPEPPHPSAIWVLIRGKDVQVDQELEQALAPPALPGRAGLQRAWKSLSPSGRMNFSAEVIDRPGPGQSIDVSVTLSGPTVRPRFFDYTLQQLQGSVRYYQNRVYLTNLRAVHGPSVLTLGEGQIFLKRDGGYHARLASLRGASLLADDAFLSALPPALRRGAESLRLQGPFDLSAAMVIDPPEAGAPPVVWWDGGLVLKRARLKTGVEWSDVHGRIWCRGRHNGQHLEAVVGGVDLSDATVLRQPLKNVRCQLEVSPSSPQTLRFRNLSAELFGGAIGGEARLDFGPAMQYDLYLKAMQIDLEECGRHNLGASVGAELQGQAIGALHLMGNGSDLAGLRGNGRIDIPSGRLYRLPFLLDLLKAFGLRVPDRTAFEQAHLSFGVEGTEMRVEDLDLIGNAISLRGKGTLNLDGSNLSLDFHADWARISQLLPPGITEIPRAISNQLFKIKMRGKVGQIRYEKELIPGVVAPLRRMMGSE